MRYDGAVASLGNLQDIWDRLARAAADQSRITGLTHGFYRYPARFSPKFARAAIECFSEPGQLVFDPYMGGGTTILEAFASARRSVGCDLNELAAFVTRAKSTPLTDHEAAAVRRWSEDVIPSLSFRQRLPDHEAFICPTRTRNLHLPFARPIKKVIALALARLDHIDSENARGLIRCALLSVGQWALNGRKQIPSATEFRRRLAHILLEMSTAARELNALPGADVGPPTLIVDSAANAETHRPFADGARADLVVTSPPYPGVHMLYHRWQVDGRKETPAPYWIAGCRDGNGSSFYNFADRRAAAIPLYFAESLRTLRAVRRCLKAGGVIVQLIAFADPVAHLPLYLANMTDAGFEELLPGGRSAGDACRIWRNVPSRRWHASTKGAINASQEVVLVHRAV